MIRATQCSYFDSYVLDLKPNILFVYLIVNYTFKLAPWLRPRLPVNVLTMEYSIHYIKLIPFTKLCKPQAIVIKR